MKIRGNSHYRNLRGGAISRNAYRSAARGRLLGNGECFCVVLYKKKGYKKEKMNMQTNFRAKRLTAFCFVLIVVMLLTACNTNKVSPEGKWADARYLSDTELGEGTKTVVVSVKAGENEISFTLHTDKTYLAEALLEHELIEGDESEFGLYVKKVNGILADYDVDKTYWGFYKNGEMMMTGVSAAEIADGEHYELVLEG